MTDQHKIYLDDKPIGIANGITISQPEKKHVNLRFYCRKIFKSQWCGYSGSETWCDQSYQRCKFLNNEDNFPEEIIPYDDISKFRDGLTLGEEMYLVSVQLEKIYNSLNTSQKVVWRCASWLGRIRPWHLIAIISLLIIARLVWILC